MKIFQLDDFIPLLKQNVAFTFFFIKQNTWLLYLRQIASHAQGKKKNKHKSHDKCFFELKYMRSIKNMLLHDFLN